MRLFCLWFLIPLGIVILGTICHALAEVVMKRRDRSRFRIKIVGMLITMATGIALGYYVVCLLNGKIH